MWYKQKPLWLSLWMIAFAIIEGRLIILDMLLERSTSAPGFLLTSSWFWTTALILTTVLVAGLGQLPRALARDGRLAARLNLNHLARLYLDAWRRLWRRRWILVPFMAVALINALGIVAQQIIIGRYLRTAGGVSGLRYGPPSPLDIGWGRWLQERLGQGLEHSTPTIVGWFLPRPGVSQTAEVYAIHAAVFLL